MQKFSPNKKHWVVFFLGSIIASASKTGGGAGSRSGKQTDPGR
jgi:hypothetical protein